MRRRSDHLPDPGARSADYFLGVYTSTVPLDNFGGGIDPVQQPMAATSRAEVRVVPGYGETVYGQRINQVVPNSPAFHAGLEPGDIIVDANGVPTESKQDLVAAIQGSQGYLEMKVLDGRSGQLVWVAAETDPQDSNPVFSTTVQQDNNRLTQGTRQQTSTRNGSNNRRVNLNGLNQELNNQIRSAIDGLGGRRPPVRRNR